MKEMLFIDGKMVDLDDNTKITLSYNSNIFSDISKIVGSYSYTVKLPLTMRNRAVIECSFLPACESDYVRSVHTARYFRNGIEILKDAKAKVLSISDSIELYLSWGNRNITEEMKNLMLTDLTTDAFIDWKKWGEGIYYTRKYFPKIDYGIYPSDNIFRHPVVSADWIFTQIASDNNFKIEMSDAKKSELEKLVCPLLGRDDNERLARSVAQVFKYKGLIPGTTRMYFDVTTTINDYGTSMIERVGATEYRSCFRSKITNGIARLTGQFEVMVSATTAPTAPVLVGYKYNLPPGGSGNPEVDEVVRIDAKRVAAHATASNVYVITFEFEDTETSVLTNKWLATLYTQYFCDVRFVFENLGGTITGDSWVAGEMTIANWAEHLMLLRRVGSQTSNTIEGKFYITPNLPKIKQLDFINAISQMLGIFAVLDGNTMKFVAVDDIIANISVAKDWTKKLIATYKDNRPRNISFLLGDFARSNVFRYKDDGDYENKYEGELTVSDATLNATRDTVTLPFAGTKMVNGTPVIKLYSHDADGNIDYSRLEDRILIHNEAAGTATFTGLEWSSLLRDNYGGYQKVVQKPRIITEKIQLNSVDLAELDLSVPIYLSQYGRYYAVMSVKAERTGICECKLLQLEV